MPREPHDDHAHPAPSARVRDVRGRSGRVLGDLYDGVVVRLDDGRNVLLPAEALHRESDGSFTVGFELDPAPGREGEERARADREANARRSGAAPAAAPVRDRGVIPVLSEELVVERRAHVTGGVRLHKSVSERVALIDEPIVRERVAVERIAIDRPLRDGQIPSVREQDGVLIVPVIEEVLVVEKRLMLKEELHVRRIREETRDRQEVALRREHVDVERFDAGEEDAPRGH
jgi:uncharacterized protein (TIGR02271 family)